ncbi:MerR family transcriptional regulator, partial [Candidatus Woesebacteria bacterium]
MEVNIFDLTWSTFIYPREGKNEKTVEAYIEALTIGAKFPPITIQRVFNYPQENEKIEARLILDGIHRWLAFKACGFKKIAAVEWKKEPLNYETSQIALLLEAARSNLRHGDRLSPKDKKQIARDIATSDPECRWTEKALAERLGVIQQTVNTWISDIRARQRAGREIIIIRLNRLGWTQEQVAQVVGLDRSAVSRIVQNTKITEMHNFLSQGRDMAYIAKHYLM